MKKIVCCFVVLWGVLTAQAQVPCVARRGTPADVQGQQALLARFSRYTILFLDVPAFANLRQRAAWTVPVQFTLHDGRGTHAFSLEPNDLRDTAYRAVTVTRQGNEMSTPSDVKWYKGYYDGDRRQPVRMMMNAKGITGYFVRQDTVWRVEPLQRYLADATPGQLILYPADARKYTAAACGTTTSVDENALRQARVGEGNADVPAPREVRIATEASYAFYQQHGADTNDFIMGVLNEVEGLYERDFGVTFRVRYQHAFGIDESIYTASDSQKLLEQFRDEWNAHNTTIFRHLAFLFHGVTLNDAVGRAYQKQACEDRAHAYGYFSFGSALYETDVTAHEIGHLFGAVHEDPTNCAAAHTLMCPSVDNKTIFEFGTQAREDITSYLETHTCFDQPLEVNIYPIPAKGYVEVVCSEPGIFVTVYDAMGRIVHTSAVAGESARIDTRQLSTGFYVMTIQAGSKIVARRVMVR